MANIKDCINKAVVGGIAKQEDFAGIADADDPLAALDSVINGFEQKKIQAARDAIVFDQLKKDINAHPKGAAAGYLAVLGRDKYGFSMGNNIDKLAQSRAKRYFAQIPELVEIFATKRFGLKFDQDALGTLVQAVYGKKTGTEFDGYAEKLKGLFETMREDFNALGGIIAKNKNWNLPQSNDQLKVQRAGKEQWKADQLKWIDRDLTTFDDGVRLTDEQLDDFLDSSYDTIVSGGLSKLDLEAKPSAGGQGKKLANRHADRRVLYYKDADAWMAYQAKYGSGNGWHTIISHIEGMASEIALMERLGSNPNRMHQAMMSILESKKASGELAKKGKAKGFLQQVDWVYKQVAGYIDPHASPAVANIAQNVRNVITSSTLGSATISSVLTDPLMVKIAANWNGLPASKIASKYTAMLNPANEADRKLAAQLGFVVDAMVNSFSSSGRFMDAEIHTMTSKVAEATIRASGLSAHTEAWKTAFSMTFAGELADNFGKTVDELDPRIQKSFERYGITSDDWDTFRKTSPVEGFADVTQAGGEKFHVMILTEQNYAVLEPGALERGILRAGTSAGTVTGEAWRMFAALKSFPTAMITHHWYRAFYQAEGMTKAQYIGAMLMGGMVMGGLTLQLKDIAMGRNPRPVDGKFLFAALAQSGGLGIFGDYIFADQNRFGSSLANTLTGPSVELIDKAGKLTVGNIQQLLAGEDTDAASEALDFVYRYTPKVWWTRPIQNMINEQLQLQIDDSASTKFRRIMREREKNYGQDYWWQPGEALPE